MYGTRQVRRELRRSQVRVQSGMVRNVLQLADYADHLQDSQLRQVRAEFRAGQVHHADPAAIPNAGNVWRAVPDQRSAHARVRNHRAAGSQAAVPVQLELGPGRGARGIADGRRS
uniref:(northern house mosquito) hypothetical protein n=1 Tax=Culex pipiens TaxID=7175 RepID=A0A8D8PCV3_CULPI